uniref:Reverse transcriptase domain-containing protein n=1 Tax=Nothobranchius furzeri TaxID=105023 RepID=A0A8C6LAH3_NOTFU
MDDTTRRYTKNLDYSTLNTVRTETGNSSYENLQLQRFDYTEYKPQDMQDDIDPDNNFYTRVQNHCEYYTEDQFEHNVTIKGKLSVIHFNCRSLNSNFVKIMQCLKQSNHPFTVIAISETWLQEGRISMFQIEGYNMFSTSRDCKKGGGVALYIDKNFQSRLVGDMTLVMDNIMECVSVEIQIEKSKNVLVSCMYRKPGSCVEMFMEKIVDMYDDIINRKMCFVCGDFNIDLLNPQMQNANTEFINSMFSLGLYPLITRPTRITKTSATLIDNIFTNILEYDVLSGLVITDMSDHLPVFTVVQRTTVTTQSESVVVTRLKNQEAVNSFKTDLMEQNWEEVYVEDVNMAYGKFLNIITSLYEKNCPLLYKVDKNKYAKKPWITKGIQKACRKKNKLYKDFLKKRTEEAEQNYKIYKNKLISIMRSSKRNYYSKLLEGNKSNIKNTWRILNDVIKKGSGTNSLPNIFLTKDNQEIYQSKEIANEFNKYFTEIGPDLAKDISNTKLDADAVSKITNLDKTIFIQGTNENEVITVVKTFKSKKSADLHGFDMSVVKEIIEIIAKPLTHICNQSLQSGRFPERMKVAKVIPIYKAGDKHDFSNYRPISILSQFSKILETIFHKRLYDFIEHHDILSEQQYGFRRDRTTSLAIVDLVEKISDAIDNKQYAVGVFLDLTKAFDTVNHDLLIKKLCRYGIRGVAYDWIKSYLENRLQYVHINNTDSQLLTVTTGIPQGSVLGPLLFILYINDICLVSKTLHFILFADDTNVLSFGKDLITLMDKVEKELNALKCWFNLNKLTLNLNKTKFIIFTNRAITVDTNLKINNTEIERANEIKFLGVTIEKKLSWKPHIDSIKAKLSKSLAVLYKVKEFLDEKALYLLYCSLFLPYFMYCVEVWGNTYETHLKPLFIIQKRAIRLVNKAACREHTHLLFIHLKVLKLRELVTLRTAQFMYKVMYNLMPKQIQDLFQIRESVYDLRGYKMFRKPKVRTKMKQLCISCVGVDVWNKLDQEQKDCSTMVKFKGMFKSNVIKYYESSQ